MAFIDRTYFTGGLFIPSLSNQNVQELLDATITIREPECLQKLFGFEMWEEFTQGLLEDVPAQKWIDLRDGVKFTGYNGRTKRWMGLTGSANASPIVPVAYRSQIQIQVDVTTGFTNGTTTVTFDGSNGKLDFRGYNIIPERIGTGTMWKDTDYFFSPVTGKWTLLRTGDEFQPLEKFNIIFEPIAVSITPSTALNLRQSIIANYVYYWFMRENITMSTGIGEVAPQGENSVRDSPADKMQRAWMELMDWVLDLKEFINQKRDDYPNFFYHTMPSDFSRTANTFNI